MATTKRHVLATALVLAALVLPTRALQAQYVKSSVASFATASTSYVDVTGGTLTFTPNSASDVWILLVSARLRSASTTFFEAAEARYLVNGVEHGMGGTQNRPNANQAGPWQHFYRVTGVTGAQTVQAQLRDVTGAGAAIENLQLVAFKLPSGADFHYAETEADQTAFSPWTALQTLNVTPASAGKYLIFMLVNASEKPGDGLVGVRFNDSASFWPVDHVGSGPRWGYHANPRQVWQSFFVARAQDLSAPRTYSIEVTGATDPTSTVRYTRIMAFRTDAFEAYEGVEDLAVTSATSSTPVVKSTLVTRRPPLSRDYVLIQNLTAIGVVVNSTGQRQVGFESDDTATTGFAHSMGSEFYTSSYGHFDATTTDSSVKYENTFSTSNGDQVQAKESVIHALRLPSTSCACYRLIGFETGDASEIAALGGGSAIQSANVRPGSGSFALREGSTSTIASGLSPAPDVLALRFSFFKQANPGALRTMVQLRNGGTNLWSLALTTLGRLQVQQNEAIGLTTTPGKIFLENNRWYTVRLVYDRAAGGRLRVWVFDGLEIDTTHSSAGTAVNAIDVSGPANPNEFFYDDFYVASSRHPPPIGQIVRRAPNGAGSLLEFDTAVGSGTKHLNVDEVTPNDGDYNAHTLTTVATDLYALQNGAPGPINAVKAMWRMRMAPGSGGGTHDYAWRESGTTASAAFSTITTSFQTTDAIWSAPPSSGGTWTEAKLDGLELGATHNGTQGEDTFLSWTAAMVDYRPPTNFRSIGTAANYSAGSVAVAHGAYTVYGSGTSWKTSNRGRGDRIQIDGVDYTIRAVDSDTELTLVTPFSGTTGASKPYTISRQYGTLQAWEDCISGGGACSFFPVAGSNLVSENRSEVGIAYKETAFTGDVQFESSITDANHTITLTAADGNRHYGIPGQGVVLNNSAGIDDAIRVRDDFVTVEWLEVFGGADPGVDGIHLHLTLVDGIVVRNMLIHDVNQYGIVVSSADVVADLYNNVIYNADRGIRVNAALNPAARIRILSNTVYNSVSGGAISSAGGVSPILLQNNIAHTGAASLFAIANLDGSSRNNLASDGSGVSHSPLGGGLDNVSLAAVSFVNAAAGNLHINSGSAAENAGFALDSVFTFDIDGGARVSPWDIGADDVAATTEVDLLSFVAQGYDGEVVLEWETGSELDNLGFHLHRAEASEGRYRRITAEVVPGLGSSPAGAKYLYRDGSVRNGVTYFYKLEDIETTGRSTFHGPVSATAGGSPQSVEAGTVTNDAAARVTYGDPASSSLRILERGKRHLVVELLTNGLFVAQREDGTLFLEIPGYEPVSEAGSPGIPVKRPWVDVPPGASVEIVSVRTEALELLPSWELSGESDPEIVARRGGAVSLARRSRLRASRGIGSGLFPEALARISSVGFQGTAAKAHLELAPLRWDRKTKRLVLARRLVVQLSFREGERRATRRGRDRERAIVARLATEGEGLYAVRFEDVFRGTRRTRVEAVKLTRQGEPVPFHLEPSGRGFGPGSTLYFLSPGEKANPYGGEAVFELELGKGAELMELRPAPPSGPGVSWFWTTSKREENRFYQAGLVGAPDVWLWDPLIAPSTKSYPFSIAHLAGPDVPARIAITLQGVSQTASDPDHHLRAFVNGVDVGESFWDGKEAHRLELDLPGGVLREGENTLAVENVGDTGAAYSMVMLDSFSVLYPRLAVGDFSGSPVASGRAEVASVGSAVVLDVTAEAPLWLTELHRAPDGSVRFHADLSRSYRVVPEDAVLRPEIRWAARGSLRAQRTGADYLLIAPREFLEAASPLLEHRRQEGFQVRDVAVEDVYAEFGFGETTPRALRDFLAYVFHEWPEPRLRYVVLAGDGSYDFKDYLGTGVVNRVPPLVVETAQLWTASDPSLAAVNGDDFLPDFAIGRLPAASAEELEVMVDKILAYERGEGSLDDAIVLVADNPDRAGDFVANAEDVAATVLSGRSVRRLYLHELGAAVLRDEIRRAFDEGSSLVSYVGHGGIHLWADENVFNIADAATLAPSERLPLVVTMNCLNGYFHFPYFDSLAERLLKTPGRGAVAAFSPSGLSFDAPAHRFHRILLGEILGPTHGRLGDAVLASQAAFAESGAYPELLRAYHLFGDPALRLR